MTSLDPKRANPAFLGSRGPLPADAPQAFQPRVLTPLELGAPFPPAGLAVDLEGAEAGIGRAARTAQKGLVAVGEPADGGSRKELGAVVPGGDEPSTLLGDEEGDVEFRGGDPEIERLERDVGEAELPARRVLEHEQDLEQRRA